MSSPNADKVTFDNCPQVMNPGSPPKPCRKVARERIVIKVGTSSLVETDDELDPLTGEVKTISLLSLPKLAAVVNVICLLRRRGYDVILVSSGAVGIGAHCLGIDSYPKKNVAAKQALAAVGQVHVLSKYESLFSSLNQPVAQVLLTYGNLGNRSEYINAENTFSYLLEEGVVPIVNENDTVATQFLRFGDNDRLSAMVASLVNADWLFMLTDVDGLYTANPNTNPDAKRIAVVEDVTQIADMCDIGSSGSEFGTGGMATKISAAQLATLAGTRTCILNAEYASFVSNLVKGDDVLHGTVFLESKNPFKGRKKWIKALRTRGKIVLDDGAVQAVALRKSLFAVGVISVDGNFGAGERLDVCDTDGKEVAVGLSNYSSDDLKLILGKTEKQIKVVLGYAEPVMDRGNMVVALPKKKDIKPHYLSYGESDFYE